MNAAGASNSERERGSFARKKEPGSFRLPVSARTLPQVLCQTAIVYCRAVVPLVQLEPLPAASYLITPDWSEQNAR